jgi:hypothetical protein
MELHNYFKLSFMFNERLLQAALLVLDISPVIYLWRNRECVLSRRAAKIKWTKMIAIFIFTQQLLK